MGVLDRVVQLRNYAGGAKNIFGNSGRSAAAELTKKNRAYLASLKNKGKVVEETVKNIKTSSIEDVASLVTPSYLNDMINAVGYHKIATTLHPEYGKAEEINLVKAAGILGTKLALIRKERNNILSGLQGLKEI